MTAESRGETGSHPGSGERRSGGNRRPGRLLPPTSVMVALSIVAMATAALCAYCSMSGSNVLTVSIPSSALLREYIFTMSGFIMQVNIFYYAN